VLTKLSYIIPANGLYEVIHRFANPRGGNGALTHEQYAFAVLITPGIAAQYRDELEGCGTLPVHLRYGTRVVVPPAALAGGAALDGHAGQSCGHVHVGADFVHSPAGRACDIFEPPF